MGVSKMNKKGKSAILSGNVTGTILVVLLVSCAILAIIFSGVKLLTGKSLPTLFSEMFGKKPAVTETDDDTDTDEDYPVFSETPGREKGKYNILVAGVNTVCGNNTDVLAIVNYDAKSNKANVVQIPRDTFINESGRNFNKINSYYTAYYNNAVNTGASKNAAIKAGMEALVDLTQKALGVEIDRYIYLDTVGFAAIVDAVGGVDVTIPFDMYYTDPEQNLTIDFKQGPLHLDGKASQEFVRFRSGYANADYGRMDAQKIFATAFLRAVKTNLSLKTALEVAANAVGSVTTSLSSNEFLFLVNKAYDIEMKNVTFSSLPTTGVYRNSDAQWYEVVGKSGADKVVADFLNVYSDKASRGAFDASGILTDQTDASIVNAYNSISGVNPGKTKTGDVIEGGGINIPKR